MPRSYIKTPVIAATTTLADTEFVETLTLSEVPALSSLRLYVTDIALGATTLTWFLTEGAATDKKLTLPVTSTISVDETDPTKGVVIYNFDKVAVPRAYPTQYVSIQIETDAGTANVTAYLAFA